MNDTEKTARILRLIAGILFATLLTEVIFFIGITAYADGENLLDYSQFQLNTRIRQVGELGFQNGIAVTNIIDVYSQTRIYFYDLNYFAEIQNNYNVFAMSENADMSNSFGYLWLDYYHQVDEHVSYIEFPVSTYQFRYFRINYIPQYPLTTITTTTGWTLNANFTGDFIEEEPSDFSVLDFFYDFTDKLPSITDNLVNMFYSTTDNSLTVLGVCLISVCGFGVSLIIIKIFYKILNRGG